MYKVTSRWPHQDKIKVEWNLGKRCNLDCEYCPSFIHDNHSPHTDINILRDTVTTLSNLETPVRLSLTGGEPSVHPHIEELLAHISASGIQWLSMTTNGTRKAEWYLEQQEYVSQFVFSLHFEKDWERIIDTILYFDRFRISKILVHVMAHHKFMEETRQAVNVLKSYEIPFAVRRIRWTEGNHDLFDDMRYHPDDLKWIKEESATVEPNCLVNDSKPYHANDMIKMHMNQFKGWSCNAGIESLMINWDGEVHRATCRVGGSLGNIYNGTFIVPEDPVICTRNWCTCEADIPLTKLSALTPETHR
jgi:MoaA/NifB/PqqE/SkfB family radical SAM enzyme